MTGRLAGSVNLKVHSKKRLLALGVLSIVLVLTLVTPAQAAKPFDFSIAVSPETVSLQAGSSVQVMVSVKLLSSPAKLVTLSAPNLPAGMSAAFQPQSGKPDFTASLVLAASQSGPTGSIVVTIVGTAGRTTKSAQVTVNVQAVSPPSPPPSPPPSIWAKGVNYLSLYHTYSAEVTTDAILRRDFSRFQQDGISVISLSLYWYRLEGNVRGDYDGTYPDGQYYGKRFLDNVKRVASIASQYNIGVLVTFHTLWGDDSPWCTPDYVVDPVYGQNTGLAIVRSDSMKQAFIDMVDHTVTYLAGAPGIWAWAILNEPWYWPHQLDAPYDNINQKENFIDLIQKLSNIVKSKDGRPVTIRFVSSHTWFGSDGTPHVKNIFVDDWGWDQRIFDALDFVGFNAYIEIDSRIQADWKNVVQENIVGSTGRGKKVWITECGFDSDDDTAQATYYRQSVDFFKTLPVEGWLAWDWRSDSMNPNPGQIGMGMNLCDSADGVPRPAYYEMIL